MTTTLKTVERLTGRTLYSFKTHAKQADIYVDWYRFFKALEILSIGAAGCGLLVIDDSTTMKFFSAGLSFVAICCSIHLQSKNYEKLIQSHLDSSHDLWLLKEKLSAACSDFKNNLMNELELRTFRDEALILLKSIYSKSLPTSACAYKRAQEALKTNEEHFFSEQELAELLEQ